MIVEALDHYKRLYNSVLLFPNSKIDIYLRQPEWGYNWKDHFISKKPLNIIKMDYGVKFWLNLILIGVKYNRIYINTGPDFEKVKSLLFYFMFCLIMRKKVIIFLCNPLNYLKSYKKFSNLIRYLSLKIVFAVAFETRTQQIFYYNLAKLKKKSVILYDRYLVEKKYITNDYSNAFNRNGEICIGLLGTIDSNRRDYLSLVEAFQYMDDKHIKKLNFITLGASLGNNSKLIIMELKNYVKIEFYDGWISELEFKTRGTNCDLLISPLSKNKNYGTLNGTGSIGDAIYLQKKIIIPQRVDPNLEFNRISLYYNSAVELAEIFRKIISRDLEININVKHPFYQTFTVDNVRNSANKILKINYFE